MVTNPALNLVAGNNLWRIPMASDTATAPESTKREGKAEHGYVDAAGNAVDKIEAATGISYKNLATGKVFVYQIPGAQVGAEATMLALFGSKTKATNTASGVRNDKKDPGTPEDEDAAIAEFFGELKPGNWPGDRGGGGARAIDIELLIEALAGQFKAEKKPFDADKYRVKLTDDADYRKKVYGLDSVKGRYMLLRANRGGGGTEGIALD